VVWPVSGLSCCAWRSPAPIYNGPTGIPFRTKPQCPGNHMTEISDTELLTLVVAADDQLLAKGFNPGQRMMHVVVEVMKELGFTGFAFNHPTAERIAAAHRAMYRPKDLAMGGRSWRHLHVSGRVRPRQHPLCVRPDGHEASGDDRPRAEPAAVTL